jgi:hypothetical protein
MSTGARLLFVNCGMPGPAGADWHPAARATASHNTLCLAEKSSSQLVSHRRLEALIGGAPIRHPDHVEWHVDDIGSGVTLQASHDGYHRRFGLIHTRRLFLSADGSRLKAAIADGLRQKVRRGLPFAIHFASIRTSVAAGEDQHGRAIARRAALALHEELWRHRGERLFAKARARPLQIVLRARRSASAGQRPSSNAGKRRNDEQPKVVGPFFPCPQDGARRCGARRWAWAYFDGNRSGFARAVWPKEVSTTGPRCRRPGDAIPVAAACSCAGMSSTSSRPRRTASRRSIFWW